MSVETVSIKIQTGVYGQFRNLNNKVWFALGEYVDNAVQSFENNKETLKKTHNGKYQFEVRINIDRENDQIKIYDNAAGIDSKNFQRAFEPANIPIDNRGLHEFGMGMKTASIWLANFWSVRTAALNEIEERYVEFDLDKVLKEKREVLKVENTRKEKSKHFTEITLSKLSQNAPSIMQMDKIRRHLSSIYRKFIRNGDLQLYINDILLTYEEPEILNAPFYTDPKGKPVLWKKEINFSSGKYTVTGFIGILNTMSTSEVNGLSLFRRGRVIEGSHDEKYRPKAICGQIGSPRYKRIFGELELEGFAVSFNKGSFQEQEDLTALMEALQAEISAKDFDLYSQAEKYIKPKTQDDNVKVAKSIVSNMKKATKVENLKAKVETSLKEIDNKSLATKNEQLSKKAKAIDSHEDFIEIKDEQIKLKFEFISEPSITDLYTLEMGENDELFDKTATFKLNLAHQFFTRFEKFKSDEDYQPIISIIRALVLAELAASSQGAKHAGYVRNTLTTLYAIFNTMSETIKIIQPATTNFPIVQGERTVDLVSRFTKLDNEERENLLNETTSILSQCINPVETIGSTTGITIGYVQSGKTMSFTTLTALAIDNGFRIVIYFAGIKNNLLDQTTTRLKKDLLTDSDNARVFKVYKSPTIADDVHTKIQQALKLNHKPAILITVLKHYKHISELTKIFKKVEVREALGNNGVLIIDDEADQASLNTYARKNSKSEDWEDDEFSSTYSSILDLRASLSNHSYIQYTATPQAPLLINIMDLLSPKFHVVLTPGKAYTGGKTFFEDNTDLIITIPDNEVYHHKHNQLSDSPQSLIDALQLFLMGVAITVNIQQKEKFLSMMIHADREQDASKKFYGWIKNLIGIWSEILNLNNNDPSKIELAKEFYKNYDEAVRRIENPPSFDEVMEEVLQVILDTNIELVISNNAAGKQKKNNEINWANYSSHILVGAEMLNRGYTVEGLAVSYMPRYSIGKSNADTIQQRCRFFGYKRNYLDSCRVFIPLDSTIEYREYVKHEEIMRNMLKANTLERAEQLLILDSSMNPTRNNILSADVVSHKLSGWRQMNALQHIEENISFVSNFLSSQTFTDFQNFGTPDRNHRYVKLEIEKVIEFLKDFKIMNMPDALRKSSTIQYLRYLADKQELKHAYIFEMSYAVTSGRERSLDTEKDVLKISNIFSGRSTSGSQTYPGDKGIRFEDSFCIQIHKIKLKHSSMQWGNKVLYTLGIYYPEDFAHSFVGVGK